VAVAVPATATTTRSNCFSLVTLCANEVERKGLFAENRLRIRIDERQLRPPEVKSVKIFFVLDIRAPKLQFSNYESSITNFCLRVCSFTNLTARAISLRSSRSQRE